MSDLCIKIWVFWLVVPCFLNPPPPPKKKQTNNKKQKKKKGFSGTLSVSLNDKIFYCRIKNRD